MINRRDSREDISKRDHDPKGFLCTLGQVVNDRRRHELVSIVRTDTGTGDRVKDGQAEEQLEEMEEAVVAAIKRKKAKLSDDPDWEGVKNRPKQQEDIRDLGKARQRGNTERNR